MLDGIAASGSGTNGDFILSRRVITQWAGSVAG
jgi:hypothetical protein